MKTFNGIASAATLGLLLSMVAIDNADAAEAAAAYRPATKSLVGSATKHRAFYRGRTVEYVERNGLAITDGDIVLGKAEDLAQMRNEPQGRKALIIDQSALLWPIGPSGAHEVPYVYEAGNRFNVEASVVLFNAALRDTIRFVPRTSQKDYVVFSLTEEGSGSCFSYVGRIGGPQQIGGEPDCPVGPMLHEMGHAIGFWHIMSDAAQSSFLDIKYDSLDPLWRGQYTPQLGARTVDGYDYASIMHYGPFVNSVTPDALTAATLPAGIDVGQLEGYSAGDIDAVKRLYGQVPVAVTVTTNPPGLKVAIDGVTRITPYVAWWRMGSLHRLDVPESIQEYGTFKAAFGRWSHDPSATPRTKQEWVVEPGRGVQGEPVTSPRTTVLTANFVRLAEVRTVVSGGSHGTLKVTAERAAWPGTTNFFPQYTKFDLAATPAQGYLTQWYTAPAWVPITGGDGGSATASRRIWSESPTQIGAIFTNNPAIVLKTTGTLDDGSLNVGVAVPGYGEKNFYAFTAPNVLDTSWVPPGRYKFIAYDQYRTATVRFAVKSITGTDVGTNAATLPVAGEAPRVITFNFEKQFHPLTQANPSCAGEVKLSGPFDYTSSGTSLSATAVPAAGIVFAGWSGTVSGIATRVTMTVDRVPELYADFNAIAEPLRVTKVSPSTYTPGQGPVTFELTGSGFTPKTMLLFANDSTKAVQYVNSKMVRVTITDSDVAAGESLVFALMTPLNASCFVISDATSVDVTAKPTPKLVTVQEFYNPMLDRYFVTADEYEAKAISINPYSLERATGLTFKAWMSDAYPSGASVVYRFYGSADPGPNSHFFTANVNEVRALQRSELDTQVTTKRWNYEGMAFAIKAPASNGSCPADTPVKVYRAYNNGFARRVDSNHRLLSDSALYTQMIAAGWIGEGVVMCGPV